MGLLTKYGTSPLSGFSDAPEIIYGTGSDGSVTFDGSSTVLGFAPSSSVYSLTRDIYCYNMTVGDSVRIQPNGYRIFVQNLLTLGNASRIGWANSTGWATAGTIHQGGAATVSVTHSLGGNGSTTSATEPTSALGGTNYYKQPHQAVRGFAITASGGPTYLRGGAGGSTGLGGGVIICAARYIACTAISTSGVFQNGANVHVFVSRTQSDGKILVGGTFNSWNSTGVGRIVRLNSDGTRDTDFSTNIGTGANDYVVSIAIQSDGKIVLGGGFTTWNGTTVGRIVRLNSDGTRDTAFTTNNGTGASSAVQSITLQSDGKILVGGSYTSWNGTTVNRIVRLNSDGTRDTTFTTNTGTGANDSVDLIAIQSDGKIIVGGGFTTWNGTTSMGRIVRLNSDGTRDTAFTTNTGTGANSYVTSITMQSDGKILIGGNFTTWNGTTGIGRIVRLNTDGTRDTAFSNNIGTGGNDYVYSIAIQSDGEIVVGGSFTSWNSTGVGRIVRLNSDGTRDRTFTTNNGTGANSIVYSIAIQSDGKIVVVGYFSIWNGSTVGYIVRLSSNGSTQEQNATFTAEGDGASGGGGGVIIVISSRASLPANVSTSVDGYFPGTYNYIQAV